MQAPFRSSGPFTRFAAFWKDCQHQVRKDVCAKWQRGVFWLLFAGLCASLGFLYVNPWYTGSGQISSACTPDGAFRTDPQGFGYWSMSGFFQITLGHGSMTFTQAKTIDVIWDVVAGRGGQALVALASWRVFAKYVTTSMETRPVTYHTYRTIFLQDQSLVTAVPRIIGDFSRSGLQSKVAMVFMITTMAFVLAFPTLGSAMTGYSGNVKSFVPDKDGNFIPFSSFRTVLYVIHDGERINRTNDFPVTYIDRRMDEPVLTSIGIYHETPDSCERSGDSQEFLEDCHMLKNVSDYVGLNEFYGRHNKSSTFMGIDLKPPVLNISAFYLPHNLNGSVWMEPVSQKSPFSNASRMAWIQSDEIYDLEYINKNGSCQTIETYQWGFSFIQLNLMIIFLILWCIGIFAMWLSSHLTMKRRGRQQVTGENKAILELAEAMNTQIAHFEKEDVNALSESNLRRRIKLDLHGGTVSYKTPLLPYPDTGNGYEAGWNVKPWLKKEKWWLMCLFALTCASITIGVLRLLTYIWVTVGLTVNIVMTISMGSTVRSRGMMFFWLFWILMISSFVIIWVTAMVTISRRR